MDPQHALLNEGKDDEMEIFGYKTHGFRRALCLAGYVLSCGGLLLLFHWKPEWDVWANCQPCSLEEADVVLLRTTDEFQICTQRKVTWTPLSAHLKPSSLGTDEEEESLLNRVIVKSDFKVRSLQVQKIRYAWDFSAQEFRKVGVLEDHHSCLEMHAKFGAGLTSPEQELRREVCGPNAIDIEVTPIWKLLVKEVLHPFYIFQVFSVCLWFAENYTEYSVAIIIMSLLSISLTVYDLRKQSVKLHQLVESHNSVLVKVFSKQTGTQEVESRHLVPGDTLILDEGRSLLPCDVLLLSGQCIVDEGMLTGESLPVTKTSLSRDCKSAQPWHLSSAEDSKRHLLFCGTDVIQARGDDGGPARAVVLRTGFNTAKGDLVRSILYPKPMNFRLYRDAMQFLLCLVVMAGIGMVYAVCVFVINGQEAGEVVKKALDVITIAVPPALPAALTTGIIYTQRRLKKKGIFCISPQRINVCGQLNLICFDKTGTLTEDGLDLSGIVLAEGKSFQEVHRFSSGQPMSWGPAYAAMACCHSLMVLDGKIQGDPLDLKMFEATHWELVDSIEWEGGPANVLMVRPGPKAAEVPVKGLAVLRQFPFSSALQRMTVVAQEVPGDGQVFMKGAPEMVASFCQPETVPPSFARELQGCTSQGFRVIALAHKRLQEGRPVASLTREEVESGLIFLGLLVMENRLKSETRPVLQELSQARIRSVMVTGDNLQTAITVARNSGMLPSTSQVVLVDAQEPEDSCPASVTWQLVEEGEAPLIMGKDKDPHITLEDPGAEEGGDRFHFVLSGASYQVLVKHFSSLLPKVLLNGTIFARMSPAQKSSLVEEFQKLDYYVAMCGDGANDCGALKMAHAGISLSEQEASVASPFTSQIPNIECVPALIREGRASLVASFAVFKYLSLYTMVQFIAIVLLYWQLQILGNYQFLIQDVCITLVVCLTMNLTHAYPKLAPYRPPGRLLSPPLLLSVLFNVVLSILVQLFGFLFVKQQAWYWQLRGHCGCPLGNQTTCPGNGTANATAQKHGVLSYESTTLWPLVSVICIIFAFVFSKGRPFRKPIYTNYIFSGMLCLQLAVVLFIFFADLEGVYQKMELLCTPTIWRVYILIMLLVTFLVSFLVEDGILQNRRLWLLIKALCRFRSSSRYRVLQRQLERDAMWPPLHGRDLADDSSSSQAYLNPAYEPEQPASRLGSRPGTASRDGAQPEGSGR